jgi:hypothetical protein
MAEAHAPAECRAVSKIRDLAKVRALEHVRAVAEFHTVTKFQTAADCTTFKSKFDTTVHIFLQSSVLRVHSSAGRTRDAVCLVQHNMPVRLR